MSQQTKGTNTSSTRNDRDRGSQGQQEQQFNILPHPAKSNNPADLTGRSQPGGGLNSQPELHAYHARDPHILSEEIVNNLEAPKSREELHRRAEELNKE